MAKHGILKEQGRAGHSNSDSGVEKKYVSQSNEQYQPHDGAGKIDNLDTGNIGAQPRNNSQHAERELNQKSGENHGDEGQRIKERRAVLDQHEIQDRCNNEDCEGAEFSPHAQAGIDQLAKTMSILPDPAADRDQPNTDTDISKQVDRALHGVRDREIGVLLLRQPSDQKNSAQKADDLHDGLDQGEVADDPRMIKCAPQDRRRTVVENRGRDWAEETHGEVSCSTVQ